jgi:hypothetical protein
MGDALMTRDEILRMAREAGMKPCITPPSWYGYEAEIEHFARAVYAKAIEDAAKACGAVADRRAKKRRPLSGRSRGIEDQVATADECASAIRALGSEPPAGKEKP